MPFIPVAVVEEVIGSPDPPITTPPVGGYIAHYDPSDESTVTVTGGLVAALADKSGNGLHSTATSGAMAYSSPYDAFNGRMAIHFESGPTSISFSGVTMSDRTASYFAVCLPLQISGGRLAAIFAPSADAGLEIRIGNVSGDGKLTVLSADTLQLADNDTNLVTVAVPFVAGVVLTATDITTYVNLDGETDANATTFSAGRTLIVGNAPTVAGGVDRFWGWIGEMVIWDSSLSSGDATSVISYLMDKWGIS